MKKLIVDLLYKRGDGVSFAELSEIPNFSGDLCLELLDQDRINVCAWHKCSQGAIDLLSDMTREGIIEIRETDPLVYLLDGKRPQLPLAKKRRQYKKLHWLPCVIYKGPNFAFYDRTS